MPGEIKVQVGSAKAQLDALIKQLQQIKKLQAEIAQQGNAYQGSLSSVRTLLDTIIRQLSEVKRLQSSASKQGGSPGAQAQVYFRFSNDIEPRLQRLEQEIRLLKDQKGEPAIQEFKRQGGKLQQQRGALRKTLDSFFLNDFSPGAFGGFLRRTLPLAAPLGMAAWTYGRLMQGFRDYIQDAQPLSDLARNVKSAGTSFADFRKAVLSAGDALGYSNQQMVQLAQTYSSFVGKIGTGALSDQLRMIAGFAKSYGMDITQTGILFGQAVQMGVTQGVGASMTPQQFAGLLADAIAKGNMQGRQVELIESINSLVGQLQSQNVYAPNPTFIASLLTTLNQTGIQGLRGTYGASLLSNLNASIMNPGGGVAGQYMTYRWLNPTGQLTPFQTYYLQQQGLAGINPYTGQSNFAADIQGAIKAFGLQQGLHYTTINGRRILDPRSAQAVVQLSGLWNMTPAQAEAILNTFAPGGKLNVAKVGDFTDWLNKQVGAQQANQLLQTGNVQMLADLYNAKNPQDAMKAAQTYLQMGGKLPQDWQNYLAGHSTQEDIQYLLKNVQGPGLTSVDELTKSFVDVNKAAEKTASQFESLAKDLAKFQQSLLGNPDQSGGGPSIPLGIITGAGLAIAGKPLLRGGVKVAQRGLPWLARLFGIGEGAVDVAAAGEATAGAATAAEAAAGAEAIAGTGTAIAGVEAATGIGLPVALGTLGLTALAIVGYGLWKKYHPQQPPTPQPAQPAGPAASYVGGNFDNYMAQLNQTPSMGVLGRIAAGSSGADISSLTIQNLTIGNIYRTGTDFNGAARVASNLVYNPDAPWTSGSLVYQPNGPITITPLSSAGRSGFGLTRSSVVPSETYVPPANASEFIQKMLPYAQMVSNKTGLPLKFILGQWGLESAWGTSEAARENLNFAGIKPWGNRGPGPDSVYAGYSSLADFAQGYADFLLQNPRYRQLLQDAQNGADMGTLARDIGRAGYATDKNYAQELLQVLRGLNINVNLPPQFPSVYSGIV